MTDYFNPALRWKERTQPSPNISRPYPGDPLSAGTSEGGG